ncbi:MAG TPA: hypothetical protein P5280_12780 [Cyclobacteriaceae bacterium]|nr:hypothetical protein [Cyclobacteriaceae bacterium]
MKVLSQKVTPLKLKPVVPEHLIGSSNEPRSPDLSINLPSCEIFCEITVLQVAIFNEWDKTIDQFVEKIGKRILDKGGRRVVGFRLPMDFRLEKLSNREANILVEFILETNDGYLDLFLQNCDFYLDWTPLPHVDTHTETVENITWPERTPFATFGPVTYIDGRPISGIRMPILPSQIYQRGAVSDPGYIPAPAYTIIVELVKEDLSEQILKSLRNTLKLKRSQFSLNEPYLLIMTIGHHRIPTDVVLSLIVERIWNNPDYDWMSGICMFKPGDLRIGQPGHIMLVTNPKAINPVPPELVKVFENEQEFHSL